MYDYELCFIDKKNEIGLNPKKDIKVFVNVECRWFSTQYDHNDGELSIENIEINSVYFISKTNKLLENFKNQEQNAYPNLSKKQKKLIVDWAWEKVESREIIQELTEYYFDEAVAEAERNYERHFER